VVETTQGDKEIIRAEDEEEVDLLRDTMMTRRLGDKRATTKISQVGIRSRNQGKSNMKILPKIRHKIYKRKQAREV
jgi:hypothetical protein